MGESKDIRSLITDDFDIDSLDLGFNDSIGNQLDTSFESSPYKNMNQKTYEGKQNVLMDYLRFYNEDLCITINNKYALCRSSKTCQCQFSMRAGNRLYMVRAERQEKYSI